MRYETPVVLLHFFQKKKSDLESFFGAWPERVPAACSSKSRSPAARTPWSDPLYPCQEPCRCEARCPFETIVPFTQIIRSEKPGGTVTQCCKASRNNSHLRRAWVTKTNASSGRGSEQTGPHGTKDHDKMRGNKRYDTWAGQHRRSYTTAVVPALVRGGTCVQRA